MLIYYSGMVGAIDLPKEDARLSSVEFNRYATARPAVPVAAPPPASAAYRRGEDPGRCRAAVYSPRAGTRPRSFISTVLQQTDRQSLHAAAYYGLARIAALQKDPETAERLFNKSLESGPDPAVKAWVLVYLGRLSLASGDRDQAAKHFQDALHVEGASPAAQQAATLGAQRSSKP